MKISIILCNYALLPQEQIMQPNKVDLVRNIDFIFRFKLQTAPAVPEHYKHNSYKWELYEDQNMTAVFAEFLGALSEKTWPK